MAFRDAGVTITVNSDDPPMFNTTLNREFEIAAYTREQLTQTAFLEVDGAGHARCTEVEEQPAPGLGDSAARLSQCKI